MSNLSLAATAAFSWAAGEAEQLGSRSMDVEHLFLGLCKSDKLSSMAPKDWPLGISEEEMRTAKREADTFCTAVDSAGLNVIAARRKMRELWHQEHPVRESFQGHRTSRCRKIFSEAETVAGGPVNLFALMTAIMSAPSEIVDRLLSFANTSRDRIVAALQNPADFPRPDLTFPPENDFWSRYGRDLTGRACSGSLFPVIGREEEMKQIARVLLQAKKGNPMLVGDAGVGKTAIVEGLAVRLLNPGMPPALKGLRIVELSLGLLLGGTKYRGEFEERIQEVIHRCEKDRSIVVFIDEIHMLLGAGATSNNMDAANLLKPALARGTLRCIGATTEEEYRKHIEKDPALERRFQVVWIDEPTLDETKVILEGIRPKLENHHGVHISGEAIEKAIEASVRYLPEFHLPDKAIDVLDQACARLTLATLSPGPRKTVLATPDVGVEEVAAVISERCRIPIHRLTMDQARRFARMEEELSKRVLGQPHAVSAVARAIQAGKAGVRDERRPLGVFLFLGPTGVGKTELATALSDFFFESQSHLIRIDMSEFAEKHSIAKLIGSPPGYIGHESGGYLINRVRSQPYSVILFDEIEKAHPDVFDLFLQMLDEGQLTDARGRRASFREAVIILTSNAGSGVKALAASRAIGFAAEPDPKRPHNPENTDDDGGSSGLIGLQLRNHEQRYLEAAARLLRPEIRNRIHQQIVFQPLARSVVRQILDQMLGRINKRLHAKRILLSVTDEAKAALMSEGYSDEFGARSMERVIKTRIEEPLGKMLLEGNLLDGQQVRVVGVGGTVQLVVS